MVNRMTINIIEKTQKMLTDNEVKFTLTSQTSFQLITHTIEFTIEKGEKIFGFIQFQEKIGKLDRHTFSYVNIQANAIWMGGIVQSTRLGIETSLRMLQWLCEGKSSHCIIAKQSIERDTAKILENRSIIRKLELENERLMENITNDKSVINNVV